MPLYVDDSLDFNQPVEPALLRLLERERRDADLSRPTPSVLMGLSHQSVCLYDLGVGAGMQWARDDLAHPGSQDQSEYYRQYKRMLECLNQARPHLYRSYAEGWVNGWNAVKSGVMA